jgi:uncharacterized protein (DUF2344 family)
MVHLQKLKNFLLTLNNIIMKKVGILGVIRSNDLKEGAIVVMHEDDKFNYGIIEVTEEAKGKKPAVFGVATSTQDVFELTPEDSANLGELVFSPLSYQRNKNR